MERTEKEKLIASIKRDHYDMKYWLDNYIFFEEMTVDELKEIDLAIRRVWLNYYKMIKKLSDANKYP